MHIFDKIRHGLKVDTEFNQLTIGEVVDTNDPQQMGRVRVLCPLFGDTPQTIVGDVPWATPISPFAGSSVTSNRGREDVKTIGRISYGLFNTPQVGSFVLVGCLEGDPRFRIFLGSMHDQFLPHTLPHGRYTYNKTDELTDEPSGPLSSTEHKIQPLYDSQTENFKKTATQKITDSSPPPESRKNFEYRTRGADHGVSGINKKYIKSIDNEFSNEPDDNAEEFKEADGNIIKNTHGYKESRVQENVVSSETGALYDPQIYSWTSPGFHSVAMHDAADNCRIRIRSTHGHQIIMDDTNERVYISTSQGKTWIELDEKGNIDIYGERNISIHAEKDINLTAGDTFRVKAKNGIHMVSENEMRLHAKTGDMHIKSGGTVELHSIGTTDMSFSDLFLSAENEVHIQTFAGVLNLQSGADMNLKSGSNLNLESGAGTNILAAGDLLQTAATIHLNGPAAGSASDAKESIPSNTFEAWWTDRVPEHEPWARTMTKSSITDKNIDNSHVDAGEYPYDSSNVGRIERGSDLLRNPKWHR